MGPTAEASPLDIKAEGIALLCLGYSARQVERDLRTRFPNADVPRYSTISRWISKRQFERYLKRSARVKWSLAAARAGEILDARVDELRYAPLGQLVKAYDRIWDVYLRQRGL